MITRTDVAYMAFLVCVWLIHSVFTGTPLVMGT